MEIQFRQQACPYLKKAAEQTMTQEQSQEVRLPEGMPDIGRVLGCWGQVIIRGKEWRGNGMSVSGGVMAWALYEPEDGSQAQSVECWIPFQMKWEFPQTQRDGFIFVEPSVRSVDARSTSARKLMVRACVSTAGQALEPAEELIGIPEGLPEDVQLKTSRYPMEIPVESGEKLFELEENIPMPEGKPVVDKLIHYQLIPQVVEEKIMAGRLVFRGKANLNLLYRGQDGSLHTWQYQIPFSQFAQLDRDVSDHAKAKVHVVVTSLDVEMDEALGLKLRSNLSGQYVIYDQVMVDVTEDAYSNQRSVQLQQQELALPLRLDETEHSLELSGTVDAQAREIVECWAVCEPPIVRQNESTANVLLPATMYVLYVDGEGHLQCAAVKGENSIEITSDGKNRVEISVKPGEVEAYHTADGIAVTSQWDMDISVFSNQGMEILSGLELGEVVPLNPDRPSVIIKPLTEGSLWELAKACGSTVEAIKNANQLQQEPQFGQMLLIPVP